ADQLHVRSRGSSRGHWILDRLDRYRIRTRSTARRYGGGPAELAMDLRLVGGPDGYRFRFDLLAVPGAAARPTRSPRCRRGCLIGCWADRHRLRADRIEGPWLGRRPR